MQLDRLVGLAMLILASTVFLYYTIWTLIMVGLPDPMNLEGATILMRSPALRRRGQRIRAFTLPTTSMGHPNPSHSTSTRRSSRWQFPGHSDDTEQPKESSESSAEESKMSVHRVKCGV